MREIVEMSAQCPILEIKDVTYLYEGETLPVWEHLSCQFYKGMVHAINGPSGCGKSSILYLLDGLIPHMYEGTLEGSVWLEGEDITQMLPRHRCRRIGFVMQNPESQFCTFTVEEELAFGMENLGLDPSGIKTRIEKVLDYVGLKGFEEIDLNHLSGGQKQKIAIASVLAMEPEILLLDEPTANLDVRSRKEIFHLIGKIAKEKNTTIIIVEHNIEELLTEVDMLFILDKQGNMIAAGNTVDIKHHLRRSLPIKPVGLEVGRGACEGKESVLQISDLRFSYPGNERRMVGEKEPSHILKGLNLEIHKQDFLAILGDNGVGKSTLLKLIFRILKQEGGSVRLYGKPLESYRTQELYRQVGLVFQNPESQFITNSVFDELMFSLKQVKCSKAEKERRVTDMLRQFDLQKEAEKSPFVLSQGQKRRLSVASMLLTEQRILFLDEPTYGQDFENRHELMQDMWQLIHKGITIAMITHDLSLVEQYATRVLEIKDGKAAVDLPVEDYFARLRQEEL